MYSQDASPNDITARYVALLPRIPGVAAAYDDKLGDAIPDNRLPAFVVYPSRVISATEVAMHRLRLEQEYLLQFHHSKRDPALPPGHADANIKPMMAFLVPITTFLLEHRSLGYGSTLPPIVITSTVNPDGVARYLGRANGGYNALIFRTRVHTYHAC